MNLFCGYCCNENQGFILNSWICSAQICFPTLLCWIGWILTDGDHCNSTPMQMCVCFPVLTLPQSCTPPFYFSGVCNTQHCLQENNLSLKGILLFMHCDDPLSRSLSHLVQLELFFLHRHNPQEPKTFYYVESQNQSCSLCFHLTICTGLAWDGIHFLHNNCMVLCFAFVNKAVLLIHGWFRCCWVHTDRCPTVALGRSHGWVPITSSELQRQQVSPGDSHSTSSNPSCSLFSLVLSWSY